jgi:hypothetical protein
MKLQDVMDGLFRRGYLREVGKLAARDLPSQAKALPVRVAADADTLLEQHRVLAVDALGVSNLRITALALAHYRALRDSGLDRRAALGVVKEALVEPNRRKMAFFTRATLRLHPAPFKLFASISRNKQAAAYGDSFEFEHDTDAMQSYFHTTVKKCLYHDFFVGAGAPELTPVFCAYDDLWGEHLAAGEYGVQFTRPTTIGWGDDVCRFQFKRTPRRK